MSTTTDRASIGEVSTVFEKPTGPLSLLRAPSFGLCRFSHVRLARCPRPPLSSPLWSAIQLVAGQAEYLFEIIGASTKPGTVRSPGARGARRCSSRWCRTPASSKRPPDFSGHLRCVMSLEPAAAGDCFCSAKISRSFSASVSASSSSPQWARPAAARRKLLNHSGFWSRCRSKDSVAGHCSRRSSGSRPYS